MSLTRRSQSEMRTSRVFLFSHPITAGSESHSLPAIALANRPTDQQFNYCDSSLSTEPPSLSLDFLALALALALALVLALALYFTFALLHFCT